MFCLYFSFQPLPASVECVCLFAQFLSRSFKAISSVQNYISGVRTLHALLEVPFSAASSIELKLTLRGLKRMKPHMVREAAPLSPMILHKIHGLLDLRKPFDATMWALLLVSFFTLSRKSNLVVTGGRPFDKNKQLCRSDILVCNKGLLVQFRWSKTNQFGNKVLFVPVLAIFNCLLCPLAAYVNMVKLVPAAEDGPAFVLAIDDRCHPISYLLLQKFMKECVSKL